MINETKKIIYNKIKIDNHNPTMNSGKPCIS